MKLSQKLLCAAIVSSISALSLGDTQNDKSRALLQAVEQEQQVTNIYRAYYPSAALARKAAITFHGQLHENNRKQAYLVMELGQEDIVTLKEFGFRIAPDSDFIRRRDARLENIRRQILQQPSAQVAAAIPGYPCYETVEETFAAAESISAASPNLASFIDVGNSWEKTQGQGGYDIKVLVLGNKSTDGFKPKLFINSAIHAREYTTAPLNLAFANWLIDGYNTNADATWLLDHHEIHLMLHTNPDGRKRAETGLSWRKNTNQNFCSPTSNSRGTDLNRNFSAGWNSTNGQGSSGNECSATYRGPSPASEPETQAIEAYVRSLYPDRRGPGRNDPAPDDTSGIHIDIHSFSELVLWPWGDTSAPAPNGTALQTLGRKFAFFNGYEPTQSIGLYPTDGTSDGVGYDELGIAAFTFELGTSFFQSCSVFENRIKPDNLPALIYAAKASRTPYLTPAGPDITGISLSGGASSGGVPAGTVVSLSGVSSDTRYNNSNGSEPTQNIAAVEYYLDTPPWQNGANGIALAASDGSFNEKTESFSGSIDTSGLSEGQYIVYLRARDASGNWGAVSAEFLRIGDVPPPPPSECDANALNLSNVVPYGGANPGNATSSPDGCSITLSGNVWRLTSERFTLSQNTTLSFDFTASGDAEIQGVGFDQDTGASSNRVFKLAGSQNWGIGGFDYSGGGQVQRITIPVGEFYTGTNFGFVIANDKDSGSANNSVTVSNVVIGGTATPSPTPTPIPTPPPSACIDLEDLAPFTSVNSGTFSAQACSISMQGNIWRATNETFNVTPNAVLSFDFSANEAGEIHGIGFDEDSTASTNRIFQLSGSQNWGIGDFTYTGGTQRFSIPVGQYYSGSNMRLILVNDKDSGAGNNTTVISNVSLSN